MRSTLVLVLTGLAIAAAGCDDAAAGASSSAEGPAASRPSPAQRQAATVDLGFTMGRADATIAVVEFSDFGCPYCARFARATLPSVTEEYIETGAVRWRYVPVVFGFPGGELMASAAVCAAEQGGTEVFWRVHDLFYTRQSALRESGARPRLLDWLAELGLDPDTLDTCMDAPETAALLETHTETARRWYVRGTPTFVINGVPMSGAAPMDFFRKVFDTVLDPSGL